MSEDQGRPVKPHRSGGGYPYRTIESVIAAVPLPNYTELKQVTVNARQNFADLEQAAYEKWLRDKCPSGDVASVQWQWLESYEYAELLDDARKGE